MILGKQGTTLPFIDVSLYGAVGNGATEDTTAIQAALSSGVKHIVFPAGKTFIIDGGLTCSTAGVRIEAHGATIKLKDSATSKGMLTLSGVGAEVHGGTWDGNRAKDRKSVV